jgi:hypothetical protein
LAGEAATGDVVTPDEARELARRQNDADAAAGLLPSRYVTDEAVLREVARLVLASGNHDSGSAEPANANGGPPTTQTTRRHAVAPVAQREGPAGAGP